MCRRWQRQAQRMFPPERCGTGRYNSLDVSSGRASAVLLFIHAVTESMNSLGSQRLRFLRTACPLCDRFASAAFTTKAPLEIINGAGTRPSLTFLADRRHGKFAARPVSTEQREYIKYQLRLAVYWTAILWIGAGGVFATYLALKEDWLDKQYPSPNDWSYLTRHAWRRARHEEAEEAYGRSMVNWGLVASSYRRVFALCETGGLLKTWSKPLEQTQDWESYDFPGFDKELIRREPVSPLSNLERIGFDISKQSEAWRRCYVASLMGMAKAAEMDEGWVRDKKRAQIWPKDMVVGPSNPHPKPPWPGCPPPPAEENCEQAYDDPSFFYIRILTTTGLSQRQHMDAILAYAAWKDYKGDSTTAQKLYEVSLRMACDSFSSAHASVPVEAVVNVSTGIVDPRAPFVTPNILRTCTALASHYVRHGDVSGGLAIYISALRARQSSRTNQNYTPSKSLDLSLRNPQSIIHWIASIPYPSVMPPPLPSGDELFLRDPTSNCEEAALMTYIGEVLFASTASNRNETFSEQRMRQGLSWTRDAVRLADVGNEDSKVSNDRNRRRICIQCLDAGLENWSKMVKAIAATSDRNKSTGRVWSAWLPLAGSSAEEEAWDQELETVMRRRAVLAEEKMMMQINRQIARKSDWFVL